MDDRALNYVIARAKELKKDGRSFLGYVIDNQSAGCSQGLIRTDSVENCQGIPNPLPLYGQGEIFENFRARSLTPYQVRVMKSRIQRSVDKAAYGVLIDYTPESGLTLAGYPPACDEIKARLA